MHTPRNGPIPPLPDVATSNYSVKVITVFIKVLTEEEENKGRGWKVNILHFEIKRRYLQQ